MNLPVLLHNPECSKSRKAIEILNQFQVSYSIREYLKSPLEIDELNFILNILKISAIDIIRKKEKIIQEENISLENENEALQALVNYPILLERPIFIFNSHSGVIGRPSENLINFLS